MNFKKIFYVMLLIIAAIIIADVVYVAYHKGKTNNDSADMVTGGAEATTAPESEGGEAATAEPTREEVPPITPLISETMKSPVLEEAIKKEIGFPSQEDVEATRYYYNYIDLNDDGTEEVFVELVGPFTSGSGGDTGLLYALSDDGFQLLQHFTLISNPIIVSNQTTNGWHDLILPLSGGGAKPTQVVMKYDGSTYPNPGDAPSVEEGTLITGTAIISDDITADFEAGKGLYLK